MRLELRFDRRKAIEEDAPMRPVLALRRGETEERLKPRLLHRRRHLAHLLRPAPPMLDRAGDHVSREPLPVRVGKRVRERLQDRVLHTEMSSGDQALRHQRLHSFDDDAPAHLHR